MNEEKVKSGTVVMLEMFSRLAIICLCIIGLVIMASRAVSAETVQTQKQADVQTDAQRLEGRWVRPDGGYILELREIKKDGSLKAAMVEAGTYKIPPVIKVQ